MAQRGPTTTIRRSRETARSNSTPPWFAQNCRDRSGDQQENDCGKGQIQRVQRSPQAQKRTPSGAHKRGGALALSPTPTPADKLKLERGESQTTSERTHSSFTPQLRNTDIECEIDLPAEEDFVEGGVELSPSRDGAIFETIVRPPPPTRPLAQLEDRLLEEFWPGGSNGSKALFLDYDGTLREFEARPELAVPTQEIRELLAAIEARTDIMPHIISGRNASFLEAHFGQYSRFTLVAEHGFQIWRPQTQSWALWDGTTNHEIWKSLIRSVMAEFVNETPGSHLEEKASSLVWHYREVSNESKAEEKAVTVIARLGRLVEDGNLTDVRISHGHKIVEASYQKVRKGPVMRKLCEDKALFGEPFVGVLTAGDDVSDESMFDAAPSDCLTIKVGSAATSARYRVESPAELRAFLWKLLQRGAEGSACE